MDIEIKRFSELRPKNGMARLSFRDFVDMVKDDEFIVKSFETMVFDGREVGRFVFEFGGMTYSVLSGSKVLAEQVKEVQPPFRAKIVIAGKGSRKYFRFV